MASKGRLDGPRELTSRRQLITPASQIVGRDEYYLILKEYVIDELTNIEEAAIAALSAQKTTAVVKIANNLHIPPLSPKATQRKYYYYVLNALDKAGYQPKIDFLRNGDVQVIITLQIDYQENDTMDSYIEEHLFKAPVKQSIIVKPAMRDGATSQIRRTDRFEHE